MLGGGGGLLAAAPDSRPAIRPPPSAPCRPAAPAGRAGARDPRSVLYAGAGVDVKGARDRVPLNCGPGGFNVKVIQGTRMFLPHQPQACAWSATPLAFLHCKKGRLQSGGRRSESRSNYGGSSAGALEEKAMDVSIAISALAVLLAAVVGSWYALRGQKSLLRQERRLAILRDLVSYRIKSLNRDFLAAVNLLDIEYPEKVRGSKAVRDALEKLLASDNLHSTASKRHITTLVCAVSKTIGIDLKEFTFDDGRYKILTESTGTESGEGARSSSSFSSVSVESDRSNVMPTTRGNITRYRGYDETVARGDRVIWRHDPRLAEAQRRRMAIKTRQEVRTGRRETDEERA